MTNVFTVPEAAERLRVSPRTVRRLIASGELRPVRIGRRTVLTERELEAFLAAAFRRSA